jgi:hypothetical protein
MPQDPAASAMSFMQSLMGQSQSLVRSQGKRQDTEKETPEQKIWRSQIEKAISSGDHTLALGLIRDADEQGAGIPVAPYASAIKNANPLAQVISNLINPSQDAGGKSPFERTDVAMNAPEGMLQPRPGGIASLFDENYLRRFATKKATGIDIGLHTESEKYQWMQWYNGYMENNPGAEPSQGVEAGLVNFGWAPEEIVHFKNLDRATKLDATRGMISKLAKDPEFDAAFKQSYGQHATPNTKLGAILNYLSAQENAPIPDEMIPVLNKFNEHSEAIQAIKAQQIFEETYARGMGEEKAAADSFKGVLGRETETTQMRHDVNKPRMPATEVKGVAGASSSLKLAESATQDILHYIKDAKGGINLDRLPVGPIGEPFRKRMDKYGIKAEEERIRLRATTIKLLKAMYAVSGKQLSDKEIALVMQEYVTMEDSPLQFVTKLSQMQRNIIRDAESSVESFKAAGYDIGELGQVVETLKQFPILEESLKGGEQKPKAPQAALDYLKENPQLIDQFEAMYGYRPEGY